MLDYMRKHAQSPFIKALLIAVAASFFVGFGILTGIRRIRGEEMDRNTIAIVNNQVITLGQYQRAYQQALKRYEEEFETELDETMVQQLNIRENTLNNLIEDALLRGKARSLGLRVTDEEVKFSIRTQPAFQDDLERFDRNRYLQVLRYYRMTPGDFEEAQRERLLISRLEALLRDSVSISEEELWEYFLIDSEKVNLNLVPVDPAQLKDLVRVTRSELKKHFDQNQENFRTPPRRKAEYLAVEINNFLKEAKVSSQEVEEHYYSYRDNYRIPKEIRARHILIQTDPQYPETFVSARKEAESILEKVRAGESFAKLARKYSQDPGSAEAGGDLGYFRRGEMVKSFEEVAFSLKKGEVSDLVHTPYGYHIIKVEDIKESTAIPLSETEELITNILRKHKAKESARDRAQEIYQQIMDGKTLEKIAIDEELTLIETFPFAEGEEIAGVTDPLIFSQAAFSLKVGEPSPVVSGEECFYLLKVVEEIPPRIPEFPEVKDKAKEKFLQEKTRELARERAEKILKRLKRGKAIGYLLTEYKLKKQETGWFSPYEESIPVIGASKEVSEIVRTLTKRTPFPDKVVEYQDKVYITWLKEKKEADKADFSEQKEELSQILLEMKREEFRQNWLNDLRGKVKIDYNEEIIRSFI
ncbi:MAG: SurA N-terminal domain-containing protein [Deltaproteobacteria bacterium]|nr:MAG: SurA N-terminal domain-containing protein [Deltaproteobacteria bacterium]